MKKAIEILKEQITECDNSLIGLNEKLDKLSYATADQSKVQEIKGKILEVSEIKEHCSNAITKLKA